MFQVDLRWQRGRRTRERLISASLKLFGARGFKAVTTRAIAREARANQASIVYHFGGKRQLYLTVAARITADVRAALQPAREKARTQPLTLASTHSSLIGIVLAFVRQLCSYSDNGAAASFITRELANPDFGYVAIYEGFFRDLHVEVTVLLARATARLPRNQGAMIDAHALIGAALGFAAARRTLSQRSFRPVHAEGRVDAIADRITEITSRIMERKSAPRPSRRVPPARTPSR